MKTRASLAGLSAQPVPAWCLLVQALDLVGVRSRLVRWLYRLPAITDLSELPSRLDLHTAVQVRDGDRWLLADPTIDEGLRGLLPVASWELSRHSTTAFCPRSAVWVIPDDQRQVGAASEAVAAAWSRGDTAPHQRTAARYRRAFNEALRHHRTMTSAGSPPTSG